MTVSDNIVGFAPLTIVTLKGGTQQYVYGPNGGMGSGDPYPVNAEAGELERHMKRGFVGPEGGTYDPESKSWSMGAKRSAPTKPADK
jgi:hypothetical protein